MMMMMMMKVVTLADNNRRGITIIPEKNKDTIHPCNHPSNHQCIHQSIHHQYLSHLLQGKVLINRLSREVASDFDF
jgi:hypothetical protein